MRLGRSFDVLGRTLSGCLCLYSPFGTSCRSQRDLGGCQMQDSVNRLLVPSRVSFDSLRSGGLGGSFVCWLSYRGSYSRTYLKATNYFKTATRPSSYLSCPVFGYPTSSDLTVQSAE